MVSWVHVGPTHFGMSLQKNHLKSSVRVELESGSSLCRQKVRTLDQNGDIIPAKINILLPQDQCERHYLKEISSLKCSINFSPFHFQRLNLQNKLENWFSLVCLFVCFPGVNLCSF